ncbi:sensor histidine kinase [Paracidobacterium acidisoli]|uniref:histidine kinase n=1 Tax=Paracidobacterium acidisoli TaxID=2303751 RepID=A0A372IUR6_9BACT|nr:ATP-binding protein [Paracidobacterium acidisoli]MBT9329991.1 PAS domain-containing protein [Paracidobacterium acidisoli]
MLSLYQRLILGCLLLIALVTAVSMLVRTSFVRLADLADQVHRADAAVASLTSARAALAYEELIAARLETGADSATRKQLQDQALMTRSLLRVAQENVSRLDPSVDIAGLSRRHEAALAQFPQPSAKLTMALEDLLQQLRRNVEQLTALRNKTVSGLLDQQESLRARLITACGLSIAAATAISIVMLTLVIVPLKHTARIARRIGQGDLHQRIEWRSRDDLGVIATELNRLAVRLRDLRETESGRRQMEFQLSDAVVRSIFEPVIVTDAKGHILKLNQAAMELLGDGSSDRMVLANTPGGDRILGAIRSAVSMQRMSTGEGDAALLPMRIGQAERSYRLRTTPMRDGEGKLLGTVTVLEDVTELAQVDRFKTRFLTVASQKLRDPLQRLRLSLYALAKGHAGDLRPLQCDLVQGAETEAEQLDSLMADLIEVGELETGRREMRAEKLRPADILQNAISRFRDEARTKSIELELSVFADLAYVSADRRAVRTILDNLLTNALRYTPSGGEIRLGATEMSERIQFFVRDNGRGIEAERLPRIFGRFSEGSRDGTGLGLALVRRLVESQGGQVSVESRLGHGTTFSFTLPIASAGESRHPVEAG